MKQSYFTNLQQIICLCSKHTVELSSSYIYYHSIQISKQFTNIIKLAFIFHTF